MIKIFLLVIMMGLCGTSIAQNNVEVKVDSSYSEPTDIYGYPYSLPPWVSIVKSVEGDEWFYNKTPVSNEKEILKIWVKVIYKSTTREKKIYKNAYEVYLMEFDFKNRKYKTFETALYNSTGSVLDIYSEEFPKSETVFPDSVFEQVFEQAERRFKKW